MKKKEKDKLFDNLPACAVEFIKLVIKKMRYRKKVRADVMAELAAHFEDELHDCKSDEEKEQKAQQLIADFGDVKLLAVLLRRAKKRCRPLWRTIVARSFQAIGILILCFIFYTAWFLTGEPAVDIDYLAVWNQMSRPQLADEENAWPYYEKAIELLVEPRDDLKELATFKNYKEPPYRRFGKLTKAEQKAIREWVEQNEAAWQQFVIGSSKRYCYRQYKIDDSGSDYDKWLWTILMPHLKPLRYLLRAGIWGTRIELEQGNTEQALQNCVAIVYVGKHWQRSISLMEHLVGLSILRVGYDEILRIVGREKLEARVLDRLQKQLSWIYQNGYPTTSVEGERLMFLDMVQRFFTKGGFGGGHFIPKYWRAVNELSGADYPSGEVMIVPYTAMSMLHARRNETLAKGNELYDKLNEAAKMTPYEKHINHFVSDEILLALSKYRHPLLYIFTPSIDGVSKIAYRGKITHEATVTVLALQRWQLGKGSYPEKLDELVTAGYLKEVPMDPFSDKPLVYKKTDDNFTLYSVGPNFKDDGGRLGKDRKGKVKLWADDGDAVFWPVCK